MKRFLTTSFIILALIVSTAGAAPAVHADPVDPNDFLPDAVGAAGISEGSAGMGATGAGAVDPAAEKTVTQLPPSPDISKGLDGIMAYIVQLFAWLLGVAIITLDYAVFYTVVTMGTYVNNLSAIGITWQVMRDIGNIVIIFGFLAAGIATIINVDMYGWGKKMLPMLLVAAVFINFSLFLSEAVIDTGNLFATQFYTQINGGQPAGAKISAGVLTGINNEGISNKIMSSLGLLTIYGDVKNNPKAQELLDNAWTIGFMSIILFLVAAFVMFSLAFILIARFVILLFLIIVAPIGFAGLAVPKLEGTAKKWWSALFEQTITAPVLLLLLYIALRVITDVNFLTGLGATKEGWTGTTANNISSFASVLISFLIAMGLLLAVVILSKKLSAFGAAGASKLAGKLSGLSIAAAAPGWLGRHTAGLGANYAAKKLRGTAFGRSFVGRGIAGTLEKRVAGASFDVRNTELGKSASKVGLDLGKGQTGGYNTDLEERVKSYEKAAAGITGGAKEAQEKKTAAQAEANMEAARRARDNAKGEHDKVAPALKQERDRLSAEVQQLEKEKAEAGIGTYRANEIDKKLIPARESLAKSNTTLNAANEKLAKAENDLADRTKDEKTAREYVGTAKKQAQIGYGKRLENKWGKIPIFGTAATAAAGRVKSNAGKSKKQIEIEAFMATVQANAGTTPVATATPAPTETPPTGGGAGTPS